MRPELHFRAGSATKSLVATVVLRLVAEARLSLLGPGEEVGLVDQSAGLELPPSHQADRSYLACWRRAAISSSLLIVERPSISSSRARSRSSSILRSS
jgi:Beta-lactamase